MFFSAILIQTMELLFSLSSPHAIEPSLFDSASPGIDFYSPRNVILQPGEQLKLNTHVKVQFPIGKIGLMKDKSSVVTQNKLKVDGGVIDTGYRGDIIVILRNIGSQPASIQAGDPIAQMILIDCQSIVLRKVKEILTDTLRGTRGFGHSRYLPRLKNLDDTEKHD